MDNIQKNYELIATNTTRLFIVPDEYRILWKIIFPLKNAIGSYIIGNALECIALCGTVSEMLSIFRFEIAQISIEGRKISDEKRQHDSLIKFEKLGQYNRVKKLLDLKLIDSSIKDNFDVVRCIRNDYLHNLSQSLENISPDAKKTFDATLDNVLKITGLTVDNGRAILNQEVLNYLERKNLLHKNTE